MTVRGKDQTETLTRLHFIGYCLLEYSLLSVCYLDDFLCAVVCKQQQFTHKYHGSSSFAQPQVLQPVLLPLVFPRASLRLRLLLRGTAGSREGRRRGSGGDAGCGRGEESLSGEGLQGLLPLLIALRGENRHALEGSDGNAAANLRDGEM